MRYDKARPKIVVLLFCLWLPACAANSLIVARVTDGDTLVLNDGRHVRLIGVDTPESFTNRKLAKDAKALNQEREVMRVLEKCGYSFEGVSRKAVLKDSQFLDEYRYAKIKS